MKSSTQQNINKLFLDFVDSIENYTFQRKNSDHIGDVVAQGLLVFLKFPYSISVSLFLLNDLTFEFEHSRTEPGIFSSENVSFFNKFIDKGIIGSTLESGQKVIYPKDEAVGQDCIIFPLITSNSGVVGLLMLTLESIPEAKTKTAQMSIDNLYKMSSILTSLFATVIENSLFFQNLNKTQSLLEQKVAARTMSLAQSKRELQTILNTIQTGILLVEADTGKIMNTNPIASQIIGLKQEDMIGQFYTDFLPPADIDDYGTSRKKGNFESVLKRHNGLSIPVLRNVANIYLGNQRFRIESFLDITDRKNSELALKKANELLELKVQERTIDLQLLVHKLKEEVSEREKAEKELRRLLENEKEVGDLKTRFISLVSHEFRTPMTIIRSAAQMIDKFKEKLSDDEKTEKIKRILVTVDTMSDILENVLFIGKTDSGTVSLNPRQVDLKEYCLNIINDLQLGLNIRRNVNFTTASDDNTTYVDIKLLRHILFNLLSNAIKFSDENTTIDFMLECHRDRSVFTIKDYGIGIPAEEQEKIFELFYRARNTGAVSGTGLGMSVIIRSVKLQGGKIELTSKVNSGTTIKVTIPNLINLRD